MLDENTYPHFISDNPRGIDCFEGHTQEHLAKNICAYIKSIDALPDKKAGGNIPRIIGLEGGWGVGKSNVVSMIAHELSKNSYYTFTYDAWGHQEDLQRRSILETLTNNLIDNQVLQGKVSIRMRNGKLNYADWKDQLGLLLSNKSTTITKSIPRLSGASVWGIILIALYSILNVITGEIKEACSLPFWVILLINISPILIGGLLVLYHHCKDGDWDWALKLITQKEDNTIDEEFTSSEEPSVDEFKNWLDSISQYLSTKQLKNKLIVVFDNMDRLPSKKVMQLWSSIYTFFAGGEYENIWAMIPYDYEHLCLAILNGKNDNVGQDSIKRFINKTFPITYTVPQPVVTDYKKLFNTYFEQGFGQKEKDQEHICLVFMSLHPKANPRTVILFVNELVAMKLQWPDQDNIRLQIMALYILKKDKLLYNGESLEVNLLGNDIFKDISSFYPETEDVRAKLCQLAYGLHDIEKAAELPMLRTLKSRMSTGESILDLADHANFVPVLEKILSDESMINQHLDEAVRCLYSLDGAKLNEEAREAINKKWDFLANIMNRKELSKPRFDNTLKELIRHCSSKRIENLAAHFCDEVQRNENNGAEYYQTLTALEDELSKVNSSFNIFNYLHSKSISPQEFEYFISKAKNDYAKFKLITSNEELNDLLIEQAKKGDEISAVTIKYIKDDKSYCFGHVFQTLQNSIKNEEITENIFAAAYINRMLTPMGEKVETKFSSNIINNSLQADVDVNLLSNHIGYQDVVAMSLANGYDLQNFKDEVLPSLSECIERYVDYSYLIQHLGTEGSAFCMINKYMILHHLGHKVDYAYIAQNMSTIKENLKLQYSDIIKRLDNIENLDWIGSDSMSNKEYKNDINSFLPLDMMEVYKENWGKFSQSIVTLGVSALCDQPVGFLFSNSRDTINNYWSTFIKTYIDTGTFVNAKELLTKELTNILKYVKQNSYTTIETSNILQLLISFAEKSMLAEYLRTELNEYFIKQDCRHAAFILFGDMIPVLTADMDLNTASGLISHFIKPNYTQSDSIKIIIKNKQFYLCILKKDLQVSAPIVKDMLNKTEYSEIHQDLRKILPKEEKK